MPKMICPSRKDCPDSRTCRHRIPHKVREDCSCICGTLKLFVKCEPLPELIYLATPYSHNDKYVRHQRHLAACTAAAKLICEGHMVFSPIAYSHPITALARSLGTYDIPLTFDGWKDFDLRMLRLCDKVIVVKMTGWKESVGVQAEIEEAKRLGMEVEYMEEIKVKYA